MNQSPNQNPSEFPTSELRDAPKKQIAFTKLLFVVAPIFVFGVIALNFFHVSGNKQPKTKNNSELGMQKPAPMSADQIQNYDQLNSQQAGAIVQQHKQIEDEAKQVHDQVGAAIAAYQNGQAIPGQMQQQADSVMPGETPQQRFAEQHPDMQGGVSVGGSAAEQKASAADEAKKRKQAGYDSSTLAIDFTQPEAKTEPKSEVAEAAAKTDQRISSPAADEDRQEETEDSAKKPVKYDFDSFTGRTYRLFEGELLETVLVNRLDGEFIGPVKTMLTTSIYSHNGQEMLLPQGTVFLGQASKVNSQQQKRLAIVFHRVICPDGYSIDLDKFQALDQQGSAGIGGKVNTHLTKALLAAVAVGGLAGIAQIGNGTSGFGYSPSASIRNGISEETSQEATQILDRFLNVMPTITVKEGSRVRIWLRGDVLVPAYANHTVPNNL